MNVEERLRSLVAILTDPSAPIADRDDAAMDIGQLAEEPTNARLFADGKVEAALVQVASDPSEDELLHASAGESLRQVWALTNHFSTTIAARLQPAARAEVGGFADIANPS